MGIPIPIYVQKRYHYRYRYRYFDKLKYIIDTDTDTSKNTDKTNIYQYRYWNYDQISLNFGKISPNTDIYSLTNANRNNFWRMSNRYLYRYFLNIQYQYRY